jgi:hypothetical protein
MFGTATTILGYFSVTTAIRRSLRGEEHGQGHPSLADRYSDSRYPVALAVLSLGYAQRQPVTA